MKNYVNLIFLFAGLSLHLFFVFYLGVVMNETGSNKQFLLWFYYNKSNFSKLELELDFSTSFYKLQMQVFLSAFIIQAIYISRSFEILVTDLINLVYTYLFLYCKEFVIQ